MKKNIGVFFGGRSVEHEISIISALQVIKAIDKDKYDVVPVYITKDGCWYTGNWLKFIDNYRNYKLLLKRCRKITPSLDAHDGTLFAYPRGLWKRSRAVVKIDVAFPVFHGAHGEDGCFQGVFEIMNLPYVGSDVLSSAVCMSKVFTKEISKAIGIPVLDYYSVDANRWFSDRENQIKQVSRLAFPVIVKPGNLGSSIGVGKAANVQELENAMELAAVYSNTLLVEKCITAIREINCSVVETVRGVEVSECEEPVITPGKLLSFDDKYLSSASPVEGMAGTNRKIPAGIPDALKKEIQEYAVKIFRYLGCSGVARIDFILDTATGKVYLNEINTMPGSLAFYLWEATGKTFATLLSEIIEQSVKRFAQNNKLKKSFDTNVLWSINGNKLNNKLSGKL
ncbi:MAG: D-alanine--D-alanine ligase [Prevotellaceae bacterium]|jgi:D-alanine-D-alanine ligase|nr:D-alanine--D-alanine ligase [Prevotellaceae bacterium]